MTTAVKKTTHARHSNFNNGTLTNKHNLKGKIEKSRIAINKAFKKNNILNEEFNSHDYHDKAIFNKMVNEIERKGKES